MSEEKVPVIVHIPETVTVKRFSELLALPAAQVIMELMKNKILATINDEIDFETASIIAQDLGFETKRDLVVAESESISLEQLVTLCDEEQKSGDNLSERPPIVTILGHVDHGKTTLLDYIRKASVAASEAGGITQAISAYQTKKQGKYITFVDTPGHEAFAAMRQRGVSIADIAVLVVAADDGVRPQTKEVIQYLNEKKIPVIAAITKIDKPEAKPQRAKQELAENGVALEGWGGKVACVEVSGKSGKGVDDLLENILLIAEVENFRADTKRDGLGVVLEAHLDSNKGPIATILVKTGTFKVGQDIGAGAAAGRIRRIEDWKGKSILQAFPATPITIMGLSSLPAANDVVRVASKKSLSRRGRMSAAESTTEGASPKKKFMQTIKDESVKKYPLIIKADTQGSLEAIEQILDSFVSDEVAIEYVGTGVGSITESDIKLAESSGAVAYGFNVNATTVASRMATGSSTAVHTFRIIYELVDHIKNTLEGMMEPEITRTDLGKLAVLAIFKTGKKDMIVGGKVVKGKVVSNCDVEVFRGEDIIGRGHLANLQQNKVDVNEVKQNFECGITFSGETKIKVGDTLLFFLEEQKKKKLETK